MLVEMSGGGGCVGMGRGRRDLWWRGGWSGSSWIGWILVDFIVNFWVYKRACIN